MAQEYSLTDLLYLMSRLRDPEDGCPWDLAQTFTDIVPHTLEESYELADAIERDDFQQIREELGDVLFQVVFYAQLGAEQQQFDFQSVITSLVSKLLRRHPHVFPDGSLHSRKGEEGQGAITEQVKARWESIKATERSDKQQFSAMDDIPLAFPALTRAQKLQKRAARLGFDWEDSAGAVSKLQEELKEVEQARRCGNHQQVQEEVGDLLFSCVNLARHMGVDSETALRRGNQKFERRFRYIETQLQSKGLSADQASLEEMDLLWDQAKQQGL